jgi:glycogen synthase
VRPLDLDASTGNGFRFEDYDSGGLRWGIDRAVEFFAQPACIREREIRRIMIESKREFSHEQVARHYMDQYEDVLARPLIDYKIS